MLPVIDRSRIVPILILIGILLMPVPVALANMMPANELWLDFEYQTSEQVNLEGVQLLGCDTSECNQPTLLLQLGNCESGGCLDSSPSLQAVQALECLGDRCVAPLYNFPDNTIPAFKVVAQFSDGVRESDLASRKVRPWPRVVTEFSEDGVRESGVAWQIAVQDTALSVSVSNEGRPNRYYRYFNSFFQSFALTIVAELLVAALALRGWLKLKERNLLKGLGYVLLANLISYPVTWIVWPSLGQFQPMGIRQTGYFIILIAIMFTALLVNLSRTEAEARRKWVRLTLIQLPLAGIAIFLFFVVASLGSAYGSGDKIAVLGLPASLTIALAEVFAVAFEALLLYLLARKDLSVSLKQAALISFVMNASSFLAGRLILSTWP